MNKFNIEEPEIEETLAEMYFKEDGIRSVDDLDETDKKLLNKILKKVYTRLLETGDEKEIQDFKEATDSDKLRWLYDYKFSKLNEAKEQFLKDHPELVDQLAVNDYLDHRDEERMYEDGFGGVGPSRK